MRVPLGPLSLALLLAACRPSGPADGRVPQEVLRTKFSSLQAAGWERDTVFEYADEPGLAVSAWRTRKAGPALWLLAGVHGEEPAGPNALARRLDAVAALAAKGVPIVLVPLCNPRGYARGWRYPSTAERDWKKGGYSVGDAEWLLPDLEKGLRPRAPKPPGPETAALTAYTLKLAERYPPRLVLDLHEDELSADGGYVYWQGRGAPSRAAARVIALLRAAGIPIRLSGRTRFNEPVENGVVSLGEDGKPVRDGSIDELLSATQVFVAGRRRRGPSAPAVIVVETPAFSGSDYERRVAAQAAVVSAVADLWDDAQR